jgi:D-sedoheptulose 7-phosphate isomerase
MQATEYTRKHLIETQEIALTVDAVAVDRVVQLFHDTRERGGRIFFLGIGGGAGNATHAVNDFRKIADIECYAPTDNVSELTARINDEGWDSCYAQWLRVSHLRAVDMIVVFSVGGGNLERNISAPLVEGVKYAKSVGARVAGIVGRDGGYTAQMADACVVIPIVSSDTVTVHTESFQAVLWHLIVSHPLLKRNEMKWEQTELERSERSFSIATV